MREWHPPVRATLYVLGAIFGLLGVVVGGSEQQPARACIGSFERVADRAAG
jgi:hypothetical protein